MKPILLFVVGVFLVCARPLPAMETTNFFFSVDIGGDLEYSDPFPNGLENMDPGDVYWGGGGLWQGAKNDLMLFGFDPQPPWGLPVQGPYFPGQLEELILSSFDLDGEDQFAAFVPPHLSGPYFPVIMNATTGLYLNPDILYYSLNDDGPPGWYLFDVPVTTGPDRGGATNEVLRSFGWLMWIPNPGQPHSDETSLGLAANPLPPNVDDDVDALDTVSERYWYWTCDHEASMGLDPGDVYLTDKTLGGYLKVIENAALGLPDGTDIDALEFCVTDDAALLALFFLPPLQPGQTYLAVFFSVDGDDPYTPLPTDESGGLNPKGIYVSFLTGMNQLISIREDDVDAIAFEEPDMDWGDAPEKNQGGGWNYPVTLANNGARHLIKPGVCMGAQVDAERDGQPSLPATLDDATGPSPDDEDGVAFTSQFLRGLPVSFNVSVTAAGYLSVWLDNNVDGDWADPGENVLAGVPVSPGNNALSFILPVAGPMNLNTYLRFRYGTTPVVNESGSHPDGEVEDYRIWIPNFNEEEADLDFGDAPPSYPVLLVQNGGRHVLDGVHWLGAAIDSEPDGLPSPVADLDDLNGVPPDDEDGVLFPQALVRGSNAIFKVTASAPGFLSAWLDVNQDGDWDDGGEPLTVAAAVVAGINDVSVSVPGQAKLGLSFLRFRFTSIPGAIAPRGLLTNGEVEDYTNIIYQAVVPGSLVITNLTATQNVAHVWWRASNNTDTVVLTCSNLVSNVWSKATAPSLSRYYQDDTSGTTTRFYRITAPYTVP